MLVALAVEGYLRLTVPFMHATWEKRHVERVGPIHAPNTVIRVTNNLNFWQVSRTNSYGFTNREPPSPEDASATCHFVVFGDSFVEGSEVPVEARLNVRLEELAAAVLPELHVTASAFGHRGSGQVEQLAYYEEYARHLRPKVVVLVFVSNDFRNNHPVLHSMATPNDPDHLAIPSVTRLPNGKLTLRPPASSYSRISYGLADPRPPISWLDATKSRIRRTSWFGLWLTAQRKAWLPPPPDDFIMARGETLSRDPRYAQLLDGWRPTEWHFPGRIFGQAELPRILEDALEYTAFAFEQFKARADQDGVQLVLLASHEVRQHSGKVFERMSKIADAVDIPVVDQAEYILRQGAELADAEWPHDPHWNVAGHRWAAEALVEYLTRHQQVCEGSAQ